MSYFDDALNPLRLLADEEDTIGGFNDLPRGDLSATPPHSVSPAPSMHHLSALSAVELEAREADLKDKIEKQRRAGHIAATVLSRVKRHLDEREEQAHSVLDDLQRTFHQARNLLMQSADSRRLFAAEARVPVDVTSTPAQGPVPRQRSAVLAEIVPSVHALADTVDWLQWAFTSGLSAAIRDDAELRSSAYLALEERHVRMRRELEEQAQVLIDAQAALEAESEKVEQRRVEKQALEQSIAILDREIAGMESQTSAADELLALRKAAEEAQAEMIGAKRHAEQAAQRQRRCEERKAEAESRARDATRQLEEITAQAAATTAQRASSSEDMRRLQQQITTVNASIANCEREIAKAKSVTATHDEEVELCAAKTEEYTASAERVNAEAKAMRRALESFKSDVGAKEQRIATVRAQLASTKALVEETQREKSDLKRRVLDEEHDADEAEEQARRIEARAAYLQTLLPAHHPLRNSDHARQA
jgi:hypothetical protein